MRRFILGITLSAIAGLSPTWVEAADQETAQRIAQSLRSSGQLVDYSIGVQFEDGTAWLSGRVANADQQETAVRLAKGLPYVTEVVSQLEVRATKPANNTTTATTVARPRVSLKDSTLSFLGVKRVDTTVAPQGHEGQTVDGTTGSTETDISQVAASQFMNDPGDPLVKTQQGQFKAAPSRRFTEAPVVAGSNKKSPQQGAANARVSYDEGSAPRIQAQPAVQTRTASPVAMRSMVPAQQAGLRYRQAPGACYNCPGGAMGGGAMGGAMGGAAMGGGAYGAGGAVMGDQPNLPNYAWPSYASHPNYAAVTYPTQYSAAAWPYIGPFYPYPQVPLGWRKVTLEWDDGWWWLDFKDRHCHH
jgi:hypothetical protein